MKTQPHNDRSAFHLDLHAPSIFTADKSGNNKFAGLGSTQLNRGQIATLAVVRHERETGRSRGSIPGLSKVGDDLIEQGQQNRRKKWNAR